MYQTIHSCQLSGNKTTGNHTDNQSKCRTYTDRRPNTGNGIIGKRSNINRPMLEPNTDSKIETARVPSQHRQKHYPKKLFFFQFIPIIQTGHNTFILIINNLYSYKTERPSRNNPEMVSSFSVIILHKELQRGSTRFIKRRFLVADPFHNYPVTADTIVAD